jgi:molybdopterin/thiamine biosynthesis adenylyltransferase
MRRPRIKPEHAPYRTAGGSIRIGGSVYGIAAEITDPAGWLWSLINAIDGTAGSAQIISQVCRAHPDAAEADVRDALETLIGAGYVEDAAAGVPADLTPRERQRYARGMQYYRWVDLTPRSSPWAVQRLLRNARVVLVGLGGTGTTAALALASSGIGRLHCIDPDVVDLSNLNRQVLYTESDVGRPKADAAVAHLRRRNSDIEITAERTQLVSPGDCSAAIAGYGLVALCADRPDELRRWVNRACLAARIRWVDGGYHGPLVTAGAYVPGVGPCWECLRAGELARLGLLAADRGARSGRLPKAPGHPATAVTAGLSGQLVAHLAIALLTRTSPVTPGTVYGFNLMVPGDPVVVSHQRRPDCPACAGIADGDW